MRTKILIVGLFFVLFGIAFLGTISFFVFRNSVSSIIVTAPPQNNSTPTPTPDPMAPKGVLLLGYRGDGSQGGYLTDTMLLAYIEPHKEHITLVSIPRDLWVPLPVTDQKPHYKINTAYAVGIDNTHFPDKPAQYGGVYGGGALSREIVSEVTGLPVNYFVSLDFTGFEKSIDILGGVDVTVTKSFEDPFYPITGSEDDLCGKSEEELKALEATLSGDLLDQQFTCRYEDLKFERGVVHMDGATALKFARSRHSLQDGSDFGRSNRQKQILLAVKNKVFSIGFISKAIPFMNSLSGDLKTDIPLNLIQQYLGAASDYKNYQVSSIAISTDNALNETYSSDRQYILVPKTGMDNWDSIKNYIQSELSKLDPTPSPTPMAH